MAAPKAVRDRLLTRKEFCEWLGIGETTARDWHRDGIGPRPVKQGNWLRYLESDVVAWLKAKRSESNAA
jgi:predicted DNA-binding transcriptional regulator AlpA